MIQKKVRNIIRFFYYPLKRWIDSLGYERFRHDVKLKIASTDETIEYILENHCSVSRFGDGEYRIMNSDGNGFQAPNKELGIRLKEVLDSKLENHITCIPYAFTSVRHMTADARSFWYPFCKQYHKVIKTLTRTDKQYFDTNFTRFYMDLSDKSSVSNTIAKLRKIWAGKDVVIVEGEYSRLGVGNDLFSNTKSLQRILCPASNAFDRYRDIIKVCETSIPRDHLVLCALGMTATVLAYDLTLSGFQAIDIGHVDVEYTWFKNGVKVKTAIEGKAVNELSSIPNTACNDRTYLNSIITSIR